MKKNALTVVIPARNEEFLKNTIDNVLENIQGNTQIVAILDGYWPEPQIKQDPRVILIHHEEPIGQRQAVNEGVNFCSTEYIMKLDAHCAVDKGFDIKLMANCEYDWTVLPTMYTLHAFDWVCTKCGHKIYQGGKPVECPDCRNKEFERKIVWKPNSGRKTHYMWIDQDLRMRYFDGKCLAPYGDPHALKRIYHHRYRDWAKEDITDVMNGVGCCFFMYRDRFLELGGMDEEHGGWGQMAVEVAMKAWLSGGRHVINKKTWFAHMFRSSKGFGFPYKIKYSEQERAREYSRSIWIGNKWPKQTRKFEWLIEKFKPLPGWHPEAIEEATVPIIPKTQTIAPPKPKLTKGIVFYTTNLCDQIITNAVIKQLEKCCVGIDIVSVSHKPMYFGNNIVVPSTWGSSVLTMFKQILWGLEESSADIIYLTEHDVLYNPSHFDFIPPTSKRFYYNENVWALDYKTGTALFYRPMQQVSGLCAYRTTLLEHYKKRVEKVEKEGYNRKMGYEPGKRSSQSVDRYGREGYFSAYPNVDIKHGNCLTKGRFKLEQYRCRDRIKDSWVLADSIPFWGQTKGRVKEFLKENG